MALKLILAIHNHQPVGNFDSVFELATEKCYRPMLEAFERHPSVRLAMHFSGPLLEWLEEHHPELIEAVARMCGRGQLEPLGGGFYEPMLSVLPRADALGQIEMMQQYLKKRFGKPASGIWLTERVWEPELASLLASANIKYTLVDDTHFFYAGVEPGRLGGYYVTEKAGHPLAIFPIDKGLRYAIPFKLVDELIGELERMGEPHDVGLVYGDDGEKFGIWPGTHEWVFEKGWLESFLTRLESSRIETVPPGKYLEQQPLSGRIYLPTASYEEMLTWALPASAIQRLEDLRHTLERQGLLEAARPFLRGGLWQNFLVKYPEANHLHKKMLLVSRKVSEAAEQLGERSRRLSEARRELYRGQCNCAYWHGLFGGLYLPHLRDAVYQHLIRAERLVDSLTQGDDDWIAFDQEDFDCDLQDEFLVENRWLNVYLDPGAGGALTEIDYRPAAYCLTDVLSRRSEGYHREILQRLAEGAAGGSRGDGPPASIHERQRHVDPQIKEKLVVDRTTRWSLIDRFPSPSATLADMQADHYQEEGNFLGQPYHVELARIDEAGECDFEMLMIRHGSITRGGKEYPLVLEKRITVPADGAELRVRYRLRNLSAEELSLAFVPEINLSLLAPEAEDRVYEFDGVGETRPPMRSTGEVDGASWFALADYSRGVRVRLEFTPPADVWRYPVETVSQSEDGFELNYQGSAILPRWRLLLPANGETTIELRLRLEDLAATSRTCRQR